MRNGLEMLEVQLALAELELALKVPLVESGVNEGK